jgi:hypothetical protein
MLVHERLHTIEPFALTVRHVEVHWAFLTFLDEKLLAALSPRRLFTARLFIKALYLWRWPARRWRRRGIRRRAGASCIDIPAFKP